MPLSLSFLAVGPLDVKMIGRKDPVSAGRTYEFRCQAVGARPPPTVTWWRGSAQLRDNVTNRVCLFERLRESRLLIPPGRGGEVTQPLLDNFTL